MLSWHDLTRFIAELRRRRVFRVAVGYVVVTFAILKGAGVLFPALLLPPWTLTLLAVLILLGLPVALVLAWAFDIGPDGIRRTEPGAPAGAGSPRPLRAGPAALAALLVVTAIVAAWSFTLLRNDEHVDLSPDRIAILPFAVRGSPDIGYLDEALVDLLSTKLNHACELRAVDPNALLHYVRTQFDGGAADIGTAVETARRFGAGLFVLGSVSQTGGQLQLRATLYDHRGNAVVEAVASAPEAELMAAVDELARRLVLERLGAGAATQLARLAVLTTDSIDALKAYLRGERAFRRGGAEAAVAAFEEAVAIDATFALAYFRLSVARAWLPRGHPGFGRVLESIPAMRRYGARLSPQTRLLGDAWAYYQPGGSGDTAERLAWQILGSQPDNAEAWYILGETRLHDNPYRGRSMLDAREPFERALSLDPDHPFTLTHLADLAARARDVERLDALRVEIDRRVPDRSTRYAVLGALLAEPAPDATSIGALLAAESDEEVTDIAWRAVALLMEPSTAELLADVLAAPQRGPEARALGMAYRAGALAATGRWGEARSLLSAVPARTPAAEVAAELVLLAGLVLPAARHDAPLALALTTNRRLHAMLAAWNDEAAAVNAALGSLQRLVGDGQPPAADGADSTYIAYRTMLELQAHRWWRSGQPQRALQVLETPGIEGWPGAAERWILAESLVAGGRGDDAIGWYNSFPDYATPSAAHLVLHATAQLRIARIHDVAGRPAEAARYYARFVELRASADAGLQPEVDVARTRLAELMRGGG
jgi:tetratricopeptide (TPR) repeat protein